VRGRLEPMSPVNFAHGRTAVRIASRLIVHQDRVPSGVVVGEVGFILEQRPDTVRAPDVAFVRQDRVPPQDERGFFLGAPELAVEVLSPDDRPSAVAAKVGEYLAHGVAAVLVVDPVPQTATVHRPSRPPLHITDSSATLDLGDVVPEFRCALRDLF
jgi:Uma2 family endonuclease